MAGDGRFGRAFHPGGASTTVIEGVHTMGAGSAVRDLRIEVRQTVRSLSRQPVFAIASVLTLALGLGATTAILTVADRVLLRTLPYPRPERLYLVRATLPGPDGNPAPYVLSAVEYLALKRNASSLEQVEAMAPTEMALTRDGVSNTLSVGTATAGFLHAFGLDPVIGRGYTDAEEQGKARVVVLDGGAWRRHFGGDPDMIGRTIQLDGVAHEVIGITPPGYQPMLQRMDAWVPMAVRVDPARPGIRGMLGLARLREGVSETSVMEQFRAVQAGVAREYPQTHARAILEFVDLHEALYGSYRPALLLMLAGVALLLLIACTNVANLAIGRLAYRRAEIALRLALGASRPRILRHQLLESGVICTIGGLAGVVLTVVLLPALLSVYPDALPRDLDLRPNGRAVLIFAVLVAVTVVAAGLLPSWHASRTSMLAIDGSGFRQGAGARERRVRRWLLTVQVAFAVLLVSTAAMVGTSLYRLHRIDPGLVADSVLTMQLAPPVRYPTVQERAAFLSRVLERVEQLPGVVRAGTTQTTWQPLASMQTRIELEDRPLELEENVITNVRHVTSGYFDVLRVAVEEGRAIDARDRLEAEPVAMVSRAFAERMWPGRSALGRRLRRLSPNAPWLTVVGVAEDVMDSGLGLPIGPTLYLPYLQQNTSIARITLVVQTAGDPEGFITAVQRAVWDADPRQPIDQAQALPAAMQASIAQPRFRAFVLSAFGIAALLLAGVGAYGVAGFAAVIRGREMGIRLALGAEPGSVTRLIIRDSMVPAALGVILGTSTAAVSAPVLRRVLADGESLDLTYTAICGAALLATVALAAWLPARRCTKREPIGVLRTS
jgi:putative ABC transport system permease protein